MVDSLKLAEMQRTSVEYERQRHLANWFIKSSPHMPAPTAPTSLTSNGADVMGSHMHVEGRKPKLRRFNSHDTSANMFSVADFENARLARRNEIEMKQRLQRRMRTNASGNSRFDFSTSDSKSSKYCNKSNQEPLPADIFLNRYSLPRVVRITYKPKFSDETLQSSSSNDSSTVTMNSASTQSGEAGGSGTGTPETETSCSTASSSVQHTKNSPNNTTISNNRYNSNSKQINADLSISADEENGELFLLYRLIRKRHIYHGYNAKTAPTNRKKCVLIPQEFHGYFSLLNEKGLPTATVYTSLTQLVRERVYKFVSVDNMPAFSESNANAGSPTGTEGCLPLYTTSSSSNRPQYVKTTARGGQVFRLLAVFEDGKQEHHSQANGSAGNSLNAKQISAHGREKERGRYAQLLNENRQILYVSLSTKGKFYEIEPGIPQILQKLGGVSAELNKKPNPDCVHRITMLIDANKAFPQTIRYISGPMGNQNPIPEYVCISKISTENVIIACPIEDLEATQTPLQLRKLHLTKEMNLTKSALGFESEQRMLANPNVQNMLKFCQFNYDQFVKTVDIEQQNRSERMGSKSRVEGLRMLKPLHLPKLLRREKTMSVAHERENSIIFFSKTDLANMNSAKDTENENSTQFTNRITDKMKVFESTKKKWFRKQHKNTGLSMTSLDLDVQSKRLSMERYSDISKLLQERFSDKPNIQTQHSTTSNSVTSDLLGSDSEQNVVSKLPTKVKQFGTERMLQKSMSLQNIELRSSRKPNMLAAHSRADTISEVGTELEEQENCGSMPQSFITEKLFSEFHVKTRQYSKSSSSLHQLLNFSLPQKLHINDNNNKRVAVLQTKQPKSGTKRNEKRLDFNIGAPVTSACALTKETTLEDSENSVLTPISLIEDDLPYSSVRDSLLVSRDEIANEQAASCGLLDYAKENIYAEICHEASAMGGMPTSRKNDATTQLADDYGDYASLIYQTKQTSVSRVQVNCLPNSVSYNTVYLGNERLGEDRAHVTTVELKGVHAINERQQQQHEEEEDEHNVADDIQSNTVGNELKDNIYHTLK